MTTVNMPAVEVEPEETIAQKQQELQSAVEHMRGEVPRILEAPDTILRLARGLFYEGKWENEVEVRELTGADEEALARFKDPIDFFNGVVTYGTTRIGSLDLSALPYAERLSVLAGLLIGEREQLFLRIAIVTYGDEKQIDHRCPQCGVDMTTDIRLSEDIKIPEMEEPQRMIYSITTSKGQEVSFRLATGSDQMAVISRKGATQAEQNTLMISECVTQIDGKPVIDPMNTARNLSMRDRGVLIAKIAENQPSPDMNLSVECLSCTEEMTIPLDWGYIFRP